MAAPIVHAAPCFSATGEGTFAHDIVAPSACSDEPRPARPVRSYLWSRWMTFWSAFSARAWRSAAVLAVLVPSALAAQSRNGLLVGRVLSGDVAVPSAVITASGGRVTLARVDGRFRM